MKSFVEFVAESVATPKSSPKKATEETTGHLPHVGELLYSPHPNKAIEHMKKVHARFKDKHSPNHKTSLKVDGGMSVVVGRHQDGRHFVSYKTGSKKFETHDEIAATGKEHYVREMSPLLDHAKRMNLKSGHAFQADIVHNTTEHKETAKPNAITYKNPKGKHLVLASHSQYSVGHGGELKKTTSHPDIKQLENHTIHAPDLALDKKVQLGISKERSAKVDAHIKAAKKHLTPETTKFAKNLATGKGGHHSKFKAFVDQYNSHAARTSGTRSVEGAKNYVSTFMAKKAQSSSSDKTQKDLHNSLHKSLSDHEHHFTNLFNAHNHINAAKHHILDEFKGHAHKFDIQTHNGEEHEGIVSTIGEKHQTKLVREGPGGFPEKNERNAQSRFGKNKITEAVAAKKGKAFLLSGSFSPYTIGHHEVARKAAEHAKATGHTDFYHGIGSPKNQSPNDPLTHKQKKSIIRLSHKNIAKEHTGMQYHTTSTEHKTPFHQLTHLARSGYTHITIGLGSDQMGGGLKKSIETHIKRHGGIHDITGKVHKVKVDFHQLGGERKEGEMPRHKVLSSLRKGDISVAKAGRLRKAVSSGDTELAHALMPKHMDKPKYFGMIKSAQSKIAKTKKKVVKKLTEGLLSFSEFITEAPKLLDAHIDNDAPSDRAHKFGSDYLRSKENTYRLRYKHKFVKHENLGEIHPGYELHRHVSSHEPGWDGKRIHDHQYSIVHKKSGDVAGEMDASPGKIDRKTGEHTRGTGKGLAIKWVSVHSDHSSKKAGTSLPIAAYKHLHKLGHSIKSDTTHSVGGAHVWDRLRKDPDVKHHVKFHDEGDNRAIPAHKLDYDGIWHPHESERETTLVLHAKPKKKVVTEDIELIPVTRDRDVGKPRKAEVVHKDYGTKTYSSDKVVTRKNHGEIHPGYELHQHSVEMDNTRPSGPQRILKHKFTIVHKASGDIAGEMHAWGGKLHPKKGVVFGAKGKALKVSNLEMHPDHSSKKVGASLPVEMYRHLHRQGHAIQSDSVQSHGGAHVWNTMRNDRELKKHMMIHDNDKTDTKQKHAFQTRAHKRSERHIWHQFSRSWSGGRDNPSKVEPEYGVDPDFTRTLILAGKKRKKKMNEAPELDSYIEPGQIKKEPFNVSYLKKKTDTIDSKLFVGHKRMGNIHPKYEMWRHTTKLTDNKGKEYHHHQFSIVHKDTKKKVGEIEAIGGKINRKTGEHRAGTGKDLKISYVGMHDHHSAKKVGTSLAVSAYKHLHKLGHSIKSDTRQSIGGANVWDKLRHDPDVRDHVKFHDERDNRAIPAHKLDYGGIWQEHETASNTTLVLHKKPKKKMNEAPELDPYIEPGETKKEPFNVSYLKKKRHTFDSKSFVGHKRMGDIHPKYEMWRHTTELTDDKGNKYHQHQLSIVHKDTRKKVGEIDAVGGKINRKTGEHKAGTGKDLKISYLGIHDQHSAKKVGTSLAVAAYKHLHKKGRSIKSDTRQSIGGANVWDTLRKDPEVKRHVKFHDERDNTAIPAHKLPYGGIWQTNPSASDTTLVLHAKKKKPAVVSEDIEMANILMKPNSGGLGPRNFEKMVAHKGLKPKRSGRIAKGYTLYTSTDEKNPEFQDHHIVHDATGHLAGEVSTRTSGNDHTVIHTDVHGNHTQKVIGKSLAVLAYKHLAKKKGNLHSSNLQSPGGASIWNRLRKDPKMKGRVFHQTSGKAEVPAHDVPDKKIWATEVAGGISTKSKKIPKSLPPSKHHAAEHENVIGSRLVIRPIKKS